jgi:hypothetical protein
MRFSKFGVEYAHLVLAVAVASRGTTSHLDGLSTVMSRTWCEVIVSERDEGNICFFDQVDFRLCCRLPIRLHNPSAGSFHQIKWGT